MNKVGRLAFRVEGDMWNCYYADDATMKGAVHLGSIRMQFVVENPQRREEFIELMKQCMTELMIAVLGAAPMNWNESPAPENERSGNA